MFTSVGMYLQFAIVGFRRQASFRLANVSGLITSIFFLIFRTSAFTALFTVTDRIGGYSLSQTLSYAVWVQALIMVIPQWGSIGVADDIRSGQLAMDLCRPLNYYLMVLAKRCGLCSFNIFSRAFPSLLIGWALGLFAVTPSGTALLWGCLSILLGIWLANSLHFLIEVTGFWLESPRGPRMLVVGLTYFLSGATIPLAFFPAWAQQLNALLPFASTLNAPIEILLMTKQPEQILLPQVAWVIGITMLALGCLRLGERKVVLHGG